MNSQQLKVTNETTMMCSSEPMDANSPLVQQVVKIFNEYKDKPHKTRSVKETLGTPLPVQNCHSLTQ